MLYRQQSGPLLIKASLSFKFHLWTIPHNISYFVELNMNNSVFKNPTMERKTWMKAYISFRFM